MMIKQHLLPIVGVIIIFISQIQTMPATNDSAAVDKLLTERLSFIDNIFYRSAFHQFRTFLFNSARRRFWRKSKTDMMLGQLAWPKFPCNLTLGRSRILPDNVHKLRPGDISVIAAMGDSLTAASGATSTAFADLMIENRGMAWSIGGQWTWRNATTLPNILKVFNPKLVGYSYNDALAFHKDSQFNLAEVGAVSDDMPYMAKMMVHRIKSDPRVNFHKDWKMVTIAIGGNDICTFICSMSDPDSFPRKYRQNMIRALRYLRDNMPRTYVNIVSVPSVENVIYLKSKPDICKFLHVGECSCWLGRAYKQSQDKRDKYHAIQEAMKSIDESVSHLKEFQGLKDFAVIYQPFTKNFTIERNGFEDFSLMSVDCFHMSQKGNSWAGASLWNNILQPVGKKVKNWAAPTEEFLCPTETHPYIYTNDNS